MSGELPIVEEVKKMKDKRKKLGGGGGAWERYMTTQLQL